MKKYKAIAETTTEYDVKIEKSGEHTWGYHISLNGKPICSAGGIISEDFAVQYAKEAIRERTIWLIAFIEIGEL